MINAMLTVLVLKGICNYEEAEAIADKLNTAVVPSKFKDAYSDLESVLQELIPKTKKR